MMTIQNLKYSVENGSRFFGGRNGAYWNYYYGRNDGQSVRPVCKK